MGESHNLILKLFKKGFFMKAIKIVSLLFVLCCMNNVQSMQLPVQTVDERAQDFLEGKISPDDYLSYVDAYKIRDIRNAQPSRYSQLLHDVRAYITRANRFLRSYNIAAYNKMINNTKKVMQGKIDLYYDDLRQGLIQYGRES